MWTAFILRFGPLSNRLSVELCVALWLIVVLCCLLALLCLCLGEGVIANSERLLSYSRLIVTGLSFALTTHALCDLIAEIVFVIQCSLSWDE
jgi:hypothetical protein